MKVSILGTRGIPAKHGGFETFAEHLALYLTDRGHDVTVYCQSEEKETLWIDDWRGIRRVHIYGAAGALGTVAFDWRSVWHSLTDAGLILTLGYNTAIFSMLYRFRSSINLMNMDGIEWKREKWSIYGRLWLRLNEFAGAKLSRHLIADHPEIANHLQWAASREKITVIPYGADAIHASDSSYLQPYGLEPGKFALVIARPEPENSILEIVQAFSKKRRGMRLVVLGKFRPEEIPYHQTVLQSASEEVLFPGAIYDRNVVDSFRFHSRVYLHGHRVGGTNPSLVEALAAGSPIIAHNNLFTRWVAGDGALFFNDASDLAPILDQVLEDDAALAAMASASRKRHAQEFTQERVLRHYESLLLSFVKLPVADTVYSSKTAE